jgi:4-hydroxy-tetrahydrodipicolinate synthase
MNPVPLGGVVPPVVTPLTGEGRIDYEALERLIATMIDAGVAGAFVLGSSGEGPWFPLGEQARIVRSAVAAAAGKIPVLAGVLEPSTERVLEAIEQAASEGADAVVATSPYYFTCEGVTLVRHVERILERSCLPVVLYNIPQMTHNPLGAITVKEVLAAERLVGIKDSSGDAGTLSALLALKQTRPDFQVLQGAERAALAGLRAGADGLVPGLSNLAPGTFVRLVAAVAAGELTEAEALQERIDVLWTLHTQGPWLACLKYAVSVASFGSGRTLANDRIDATARAVINETYQRFATEDGRSKLASPRD